MAKLYSPLGWMLSLLSGGRTALKWPSKLWFIRHGESAYNILREGRMQDPEYYRFTVLYDQNPDSPQVRELAEKLWLRYATDYGDWNTPLTEEGKHQASIVGRMLPAEVQLPDVMLVSPHDRTMETYAGICGSWRQLADVKLVVDPRLHELDHGLRTVYSDWRIFFALYPEQRLLRQQAGPYWYRFPQGENVPDVIERMRSLIGTLVRDYSGKKVGVITHHITLLAFMAAIHRWSQTDYIETDEHNKPINCGLTVYRGEPRFGSEGRLQLVTYNKKLY